MSSLTERRHRQTRTEIANAAVGLFLTNGYAPTTMEDVAVAAGVSRRTAYRHFPQKADLLFNHPRMWLEHFNDIVADPPADETTRETCRRGMLAVAEVIQENAQHVLDAYGVILPDESLRGHVGKTQDEWTARYVELIYPDVAHLDDGVLIANTMGSVLVGCTNALVLTWFMQQPDANMITMTADVLDKVDAVWPAETR